MGMVNKALGSSVEVEFRGRVLKLTPWAYKVQAAYERHLEREAMEAVDRVARLLPPDEARELRKDLVKEIAIGSFSFGAEEVMRSLKSNRNSTKYLGLSIQANHPDFTDELVEELVAEKAEEVWSLVNAAGSDPTKGTPKETTETPRPSEN